MNPNSNRRRSPQHAGKATTRSVLCRSLLAAGALLATTGAAEASCLVPPGDITANGSTSIVDVQCMIVAVLSPAGELPACLGITSEQADANCDGTLDVADIVLTILFTLGSPLHAQLDANHNQCADSCEGPLGATARVLWTLDSSESSHFRLAPKLRPTSLHAAQSSSFRLHASPPTP